MDEIVNFVFQVVMWFIFFKGVFALLELWVNKKQDQIERDELVDKLTQLIHYVNQEKHGECYYWFDKETDAFLAQGTTDEEIKQHIGTRFKGHVFVLDDKRALMGSDLRMIALDQLPKALNASTKAS